MRLTIFALVIAAATAAVAACNPKPDIDTQCHDIVEHMRRVTMMPMRDGDVMMLMGACKMWRPPTLACMEQTSSDADIDKCRAMEATP
jgi:hypothetical protein